MNGEHFPLAAGMMDDFYYGIFLVFVAVGVGLLVHTGIGKEMYDIESEKGVESVEEEGE